MSETNYPYDLSLVIPFYNEASRVPLMIEGIKNFDSKFNQSFELILVNDGSKDNSQELIEKDPIYTALAEKGDAKIVSLGGNSGKGGALQAGVAEAQGRHILTLDFDMATDPLTIEDWKKSLGGAYSDEEIWIGSRPHPKSKLKEKPLRKFIGIVFNAIIRLFTGVRIKDTQCGFKLYPHEIGKLVFREMRVKGWAHDVEVLRRADLRGVEIREMPVEWKAVDESKISVVRDSIKMFLQTWHIAIGLFIYWGFIVPIKNLRGDQNSYLKTSKYPSFNMYKKESLYRLAFIIFSIFVFFLMPFLSKDYGISGDEWIQNDYGQKIYNYYFLGDDAVLSEEERTQGYEKIKYYSGGFELLCAIVYNAIDAENIWRVRHFINSLFGVLAFIFTGLVAREVTGSWRAGFFALLMVFLTPRLFAHSMNNPKDIPFAAASIFTLYYIIRFVKKLPNPGFRDMLFLTLGIAMALNIRIGGLLLIAYVGLFSLIQAVMLSREKKFDWSKDLKKLSLYGAVIIVVSYFLGILSWPYAMQKPLSNPFEALSKMTNYDTVVTVLYKGLQIKSDVLPWSYEIHWMSIANPLVILLGLGLFFILLFQLYKKYNWLELFMVFFAMVFPVAYAIYQDSTVYDGWRHFLFVWPSVVVLAAIAWDHLMSHKTKALAYVSAAVFVLGLMSPISWMIKSHPNQIVYFNEAFGGLEKAYGQYETDYYMNSLKQGVEWLMEEEGLKNSTDTIIIASNCYKEVREYLKLYGGNFKSRYQRYENRVTKKHDYGIFISRFTDKSLIENNWPPSEIVIYNVEEEGVPLTTVYKKPNNKDYEGYQALNKGQAAQAAQLFKEYLESDPKNEVVWQYLGDAYASMGNQEEALKMYNECLKLHKGNTQALEKMGRVFMEQQKFGAALKVYQRMIDYHPEMVQGYYYSAIAYLNQGNAGLGIQFLNKSVEVMPTFRQGYVTLANIYKQQGNDALANSFMQKANELGNQ